MSMLILQIYLATIAINAILLLVQGLVIRKVVDNNLHERESVEFKKDLEIANKAYQDKPMLVIFLMLLGPLTWLLAFIYRNPRR